MAGLIQSPSAFPAEQPRVIFISMELTAYVGDDGAIYFQARCARAAAAGGAMPIPDQVSRIRPGESFEGRSYQEWRAYLDARSGAARVTL